MGRKELLPAEGTLIVEYPTKAEVLVNDHPYGETNEKIAVQIGKRRVRLQDVATFPAFHDVEIFRDATKRVKFEPAS